MRIIRQICTWALASTLLLGCADKRRLELIESAPLISKHFKDGFGRHVEIARNPRRIVSLAPHITETLFAIGAGGRVVAVSHDASYPPQAMSLPAIVTYPELNLPEVAEQNPDLILASGEIHSTRITPFFDRYRIPVMFMNHNSLEDIMKGIEMLGQVTDHEKEAKTLADSLRRVGAALADSTKGQIAYPTVMIMGVEPLTVAGGLSYQHDLMAKAGAKNAFGDREERYITVTPEELIAAAPEYVLLPTRDDQAYARLIEIAPELHLNLPAAQQKHVFQVEPDLVLTPGPRIVEGLAYLIRVLHPRINVDAAFGD